MILYQLLFNCKFIQQQTGKITAVIFLWLCFQYSLFSQTESEGYYTSFDQVKIHYEIVGKGKPVLLIHGFTGTCNDWKNKPLADSLLSNGFQLILVDLRGNGLSGMPKVPEAYANNAEARDLKGMMSFLGFREYYAVGYSRGSIILASLLVIDENCKRAVIGGMGADFTNPLWPRRIGFYEALINDTITGYDDFRKYIADKNLDPLILACQQKEQPSTSKEKLAGLKQHVLIICGNEDTDNGRGADLQQMIPNSEFIEIPGNHNSTAYTVAFAENILFFLKK